MSGDDTGEGSPAETTEVARTTQTSPSEIVEGAKAWSQVAKSFLYVEVSSLVLLFACIGIWNGYSYTAYALSVACVSLLACLIIQTGEFIKPGLLEKVEKPVSLFLFVWWAVGTGIMTFKDPFRDVGNGFFSAWAGLFFTTHWALNIDTTKFTELDNARKSLVAFCAAGAVTMFACIPFLDSYTGQAAWGLSAGVVTIIITAILFKMYDDLSPQILKISSMIMVSPVEKRCVCILINVLA